jgi:hypothetical protein
MIYFVSYVLGLTKIGRENSKNAISDDLETPKAPCGSCATILKCSAFISAQLQFTTEMFPAQK